MAEVRSGDFKLTISRYDEAENKPKGGYSTAAIMGPARWTWRVKWADGARLADGVTVTRWGAQRKAARAVRREVEREWENDHVYTLDVDDGHYGWTQEGDDARNG